MLTLKMSALLSFETLAATDQSTWCHIPRDLYFRELIIRQRAGELEAVRRRRMLFLSFYVAGAQWPSLVRLRSCH